MFSNVNASAWEETVDEEGEICWYNANTGETSYQDPGMMKTSESLFSTGGGGGSELMKTSDSVLSGDDGDWKEHADESGHPYWINQSTGETTYADPGTWKSADHDDTGTSGEWEEHADESGYPYWFNQTTGETTYDDPGTWKGADHADTGGASGWEEHADESGYPYWFNQATGETTYDDPGTWKSADHADTGGASGWEEHADESGHPYWFNQSTGETTYDDPEGEGGGSGITGGSTGVDISAWEEHADDDGHVYWYNASTGESTYGDPSKESGVDRPRLETGGTSSPGSNDARGAEPGGDGDAGEATEVVRSVYTNERGNRVFVLARVPAVPPRRSAASGAGSALVVSDSRDEGASVDSATGTMESPSPLMAILDQPAGSGNSAKDATSPTRGLK